MNSQKKLLLITSLAFGAVGTALSVIHITSSWLPYELETLLSAAAEGPLSILVALGIGAEGDVLLWSILEIVSNTLLFMLAGVAFLFVLHICRIKWRDWSLQPEISTGHKLLLLAAVWLVTTVASLASGQVTSGRDFLEATLLFPLAASWIVLVPWANPVVGWLVYLSVTTAAAFTRKRRWYFVLYIVLCTLLGLNVAGCHALATRGSNLM